MFGALADQVVASLMESYPHMFYCSWQGAGCMARKNIIMRKLISESSVCEEVETVDD